MQSYSSELDDVFYPYPLCSLFLPNILRRPACRRRSPKRKLFSNVFSQFNVSIQYANTQKFFPGNSKFLANYCRHDRGRLNSLATPSTTDTSDQSDGEDVIPKWSESDLLQSILRIANHCFAVLTLRSVTASLSPSPSKL